MAKKIPWNVKASAFYVLVLFLLLIWITPPNTFARDPYPNRFPRTKFITAPKQVQSWYDGTLTDPQTMLRSNNLRSDVISFSCFNPTAIEERDKWHYLTNPAIDNQARAVEACKSSYPDHPVIRLPYLKNNKTTPECLGKEYDSNCYDWPIGNFLSSHLNAAKGGVTGVAPVVYEARGGPLNECPSNLNALCDCKYVPKGPKPWVEISRTLNAGTENERKEFCVAPPYTTSGLWWDWLVEEIRKIRDSTNLDDISSVLVPLGIDAEGRPFKSDEGWGPDPGFYTNYVPKVIEEIKNKYPGKTIRSYFTRDLNFFLTNDLDFHWESLKSDGPADFHYKGLQPLMGEDELFQFHFFKTNSLGPSNGWWPFYSSVLSGLAKHTDYITGFPDLIDNIYENGKGDFIKFAGSYIGKDINDTPGVWDNLRETIHTKEVGSNVSGKYGDYMFYLYRTENLENNKTVPVNVNELPSETKNQIYSKSGSGLFVARKNAQNNNYMSFDIDDGYRYTGRTEVSFDVRIVYLDVGRESIKFQYKDSSNQWKEKIITKQDNQIWQESKFTLTDAFFNNNASEGSNASAYPTDFRLETNGSTIHIVEVRGKENIQETQRPKAQVSCDIVKQESDDPKEGVYSVGLNQDIKIKAKLTDSQGKPLSGERIMFAYSTEWNFASSAKTDYSGTAFYTLSTVNKLNSSGFVGAGYRTDLASWYQVQVYYPGNRNFQPSRNDCIVLLTNSKGASDPLNTKMKITKIDDSQVAQTGKIKVTYQIINNQGGVITTLSEDIGKNKNYFSDNPNAQTTYLTWITRDSYHPSFNNITINMPSETSPFTPNINLKTGWNTITLPHPAYSLTSINLPSFCSKLTKKPGAIRFSSVLNYVSGFPLREGNIYNLFCSQNTTW